MTGGLRPRDLRATVALVLATLVAGCGGDDSGEIPRGDARQLENALAQIEQQFDAGECDTLTGQSVPGLVQRVEALPANVDSEVRDSLTESVDRLRQLGEDECGSPTETVPTTPTAPETGTTPTQEPTVTAPTTTAPTTDTGGDGTATSDEDGEEDGSEGD